MNIVWDARMRTQFLASTHRSRYLKSDALVSFPPAPTPLYAIQFAAAPNYPLWATTFPSLVVLATDDAFYMANCVDLEEVVKRWNKSRTPSNADPALRLNTTPYMWSKELKESDLEARRRLEVFRLGDLRSLYRAVTDKCRSACMPASFSAEVFQINSIPRPAGPASAAAIENPDALPDDSTFRSSYPPSRSGGRLKRKRKEQDLRDTAEGDGEF